MRDLLTPEDLATALTTLPAWCVEEGMLVRSIKAPSFADGIRLVGEVAAVADQIDHHPDIDIRWTTVTFRLTTHSAGGLTEMDVQLATTIDQLALPRRGTRGGEQPLGTGALPSEDVSGVHELAGLER